MLQETRCDTSRSHRSTVNCLLRPVVSNVTVGLGQAVTGVVRLDQK